MDIGEPERIIIVEPLEVPPWDPDAPAEEPLPQPATPPDRDRTEQVASPFTCRWTTYGS